MRKKILITTLVAFGFTCLLQAQPTQDKAQLEKERQEIQQEIQQIQGMYDQVKGKTKLTLGQLNILNKKINLQERYIGSINKELKIIDDDIYRSNLEIYRLQRQSDTLKIQYARTVVYAYKNRSNYDYLNFIFSSTSFNDAVKRIAYLKSYRAYREKQVATILETQQLIAQRKLQQLGRKEEKKVALNSQTKQVAVLAVQKNEKAAAVANLKSQEKDLQKQLALKKKRDHDLNNAIMAIVRREIEASKKAAAEETKKNTATAPTTNPATATNPSRIKPTENKNIIFNSDADLKLNASFEGNRGRLPWPVEQHFVSTHFGRYEIEGTHLTGDNPGITISTPTSGVTAKSIFDGDVVGVFNMGDGMAITIRHGKYFTTYSNLSSVSVKKGDDVKTGQSIGRVGADDEGGSGGKIDFILMIETKNVNPEPWLRH